MIAWFVSAFRKSAANLLLSTTIAVNYIGRGMTKYLNGKMAKGLILSSCVLRMFRAFFIAIFEAARKMMTRI
jgi:hypothetical protein